MRFEKGRMWGAAVLMLGLSWSGMAQAFCRTTTCKNCEQPFDACVTQGVPLFWPVACVSYDLQKDASRWASLEEASAVADRAFKAWTDVTCGGQKVSLSVTNGGSVSCNKHEYNDQSHTNGGNANIIIFRDVDWMDAENALAITTVTFNQMTGEIYDADIEVNGSKPISTSEDVPANAYDLQSILTHEVGHFFGLAHSVEPCSGEDCPTMNKDYREGSSGFRTLEADDQAAICAVYPPVREAVENNCLPRHGFSSECGSTGSKGCCSTAVGGVAHSGSEAIFALLLGAGLWVSRRRRPQDLPTPPSACSCPRS